jgi:hypothetical protein
MVHSRRDFGFDLETLHTADSLMLCGMDAFGMRTYRFFQSRFQAAASG